MNAVLGQVMRLGALTGVSIGSPLISGDIAPLSGRLPANLRTKAANYLSVGHVVVINAEATEDVLGNKFHLRAGSDLLSDGEYFWRRDAAEYVALYGIGLPDAAFAHFERMNWTMRELSEAEIEDIQSFIWGC